MYKRQVVVFIYLKKTKNIAKNCKKNISLICNNLLACYKVTVSINALACEVCKSTKSSNLMKVDVAEYYIDVLRKNLRKQTIDKCVKIKVVEEIGVKCCNIKSCLEEE